MSTGRPQCERIAKGMSVRLLLFLTLLCTGATALSADTPRSTARTENLTAAELEGRGDALRSQKDYSEAIASYERASKLAPRNAGLWNKMGLSALQLQQIDVAVHYFSQATKFDKKNAEAVNNLGVAFYLKRDLRRAITQYRSAIKLRDSASFHSNLGAAYFDSGDYTAALKEYQRALQIDPEVLERNSASGISAHVSRPEDRGQYSFMLARLYAQLGDVDHALNQLKRAMENGYKEIDTVYTQSEFAVVRQDPRFVELMTPQPGAVTP